MRAKITCIALMLGVSFALPTPAAADRVSVSFGPYQASPGGEFTLTPNTPANWLDLSSYSVVNKTGNTNISGDIISFQTFCIEKNEYITTTNYDAATSPYAINGGAGPVVDIDGAGSGTVFGDPISKGTGWLYWQFASGVLSGYDYLGTSAVRKADAAALQAAFWMLEDEQTWDASNTFIALLLANSGLTDKTSAKADGGAVYGVSALNLWKIDVPTDEKQTQLYYKEPPRTREVPDGGMTLMLLGLTLGGLAALPRRFRKG